MYPGDLWPRKGLVIDPRNAEVDDKRVGRALVPVPSRVPELRIRTRACGLSGGGATNTHTTAHLNHREILIDIN